MLKYSLIALAAMGASLIGFSGSEASALSVKAPGFQTDTISSLLVEVKKDKRRIKNGNYYNNWTYNKNDHGDRCRRRSSRCGHYHNGWYYANPWWVLPFVGAGIALSNRGDYYDGYGSRHVEWCLSRYRSYNIRTNTWVSYSGRVHYCVSPYAR